MPNPDLIAEPKVAFGFNAVADQLTDRQRSALMGAATTNGVSTHGNVAKALERRGLVRSSEAWSGGTAITPTRVGLQVARVLIVRERDERKARGLNYALREQYIDQIDRKLAL